MRPHARRNRLSPGSAPPGSPRMQAYLSTMRLWLEVSIRGMLLRALVAFVLITPLVVAAKALLSPLAAVLTAAVAVTAYVWFFFAYRRAHNPHPGQPLPSVTDGWQRWRADGG